MDSEQFALNKAANVYDYFYQVAYPEFGPDIAAKLAQIPADYVYYHLENKYPDQCYIDSECCLDYCNEMVDNSFNIQSPAFKRQIYEKVTGVQAGNISEGTINLALKAKRRGNSVNKVYYDAVKKFKETRQSNVENISEMMGGLGIKRKPVDKLSDLVSGLKLQKKNAFGSSEEEYILSNLENLTIN